MPIHLTRRAALHGAGLIAATAALPAAAKAPMLGVDRPDHYRFKIGSFEVTTILDGAVQIPGPHPIFGQNVSAEDVAALAKENFLPPEQLEIPFTVTLVNTGSELILFDTGNGGDTGRRPSAGNLLAGLDAAGYSPDQIDVVVMTHFHPDHIGGLMEGGAPAFPNARYVMPSAEYDFWSPVEKAEAENTARVGKLVQSNVVPFAERTTFVKAGDSVVSGIEALDTSGHTPGHTSYHIESDGKRLLLLGDVSNHFVVSLQRPDWHVRFDMDKEKAVATRQAVLGMIAADMIPFVGYHMPASAVGYLEAKGDGFRFVPASYQLNY
ncbi:MBL fold metallo-hydrolase [Rhodobacteraceae bacterium NNCM2]|nr:MBL fold metallo-hydrolase [Coraliihabitans acroporae]